MTRKTKRQITSAKEEYKRLRHRITERRRYYSSYNIATYELPMTPHEEIKGAETELDYENAIQDLLSYLDIMEKSISFEKSVKQEAEKLNVTPDFYQESILQQPTGVIPDFYEVAVNRFYENLNVSENVVGARKLSEVLVSIERNIGSEAFADMLEQAQNDGIKLEVWMMYEEGKVEEYVSNLTSYLSNSAQMIAKETAQSIYEAYEDEL